MRVLSAVLATIGVVAAGIQDEMDAIAEIARLVVPTKNSDMYVPAFQQLASVLGDQKAASVLRGNPSSDEFQSGLHMLLADVNRGMWVFNDDKPTLDSLRILAKRIKSAMI
ncbi:hypothetical protein EV183_005521 [Coemansia sp. RSA 2336]|nr:hypothetical protein EV183_005521 [Coemansia sp. RSA 2336]